MDFLQSIDWMQLLRCFVVGGAICIVGQILIDKTKLTPARILVVFVTAGAILGGLGIYKYVIDFAGCGATVPLTGFGANLAKGAIDVLRLLLVVLLLLYFLGIWLLLLLNLRLRNNKINQMCFICTFDLFYYIYHTSYILLLYFSPLYQHYSYNYNIILAFL